MSDTMLACISACQACVVACERCMEGCLGEDHVQTMTECIRLDRDCADVCRLAAATVSRESRFRLDVCALCATTCAACATECARHKAAHCRQCAEACRSCADACRRMAA